MDEFDNLTCGSFSMILIFSLLLSNIFSELVLDLCNILYYYDNILQYIYSFAYSLNYLLELSIYFFSLGLTSHLTLCILCTICYKPN